MNCDFCGSESHEIVDCLKYKAKSARKIIDIEGFCYTCRVESDIIHLPEDDGEEWNCTEKCYGSYSTEHHALFCRERIKGLPMFIPQIDKDLLPRFFQFLELDEKYLIASSLSDAEKILPLEPIKIMPVFKHKTIQKCSVEELIFLNSSLMLDGFDRKHTNYGDSWEKKFYKIFYKKIGNKTLIGSPKIIKIFSSELSADIFLPFLSQHTKELRVSSTFSPKLNFQEIIKKAPNLEIATFYCCGTSVRCEKTWVADLLKYKNGKNMKHLAVQIKDVELDIENLVKFVTTKCADNVRINIQFLQKTDREESNEEIAKIWEKVSEYYNEYEEGVNSYLQIGLNRTTFEKTFSLDKIKAKKPSKKVPTRAPKRKHA